MTKNVAARLSAGVARLMLHLYPRDFRREFGAELVRDHQLRSASLLEERGLMRWMLWVVRAVVSLAVNAPIAWRERSASRAAPARAPAASPLEVLAYDARYAVRQLLGAPVLTVTASASIAVALFVAVGAFSALNSLLFKPLPVPEPESIYHVFTSDFEGPERPYGKSSYRDYVDFEAAGAFEGLAAASRGHDVALSTGPGPAEEGWLGFVSANYFDVLRLPLFIGRAPEADEPAVVLTHRFWNNDYSADPGVLGKTLRVNGTDLLIVGVAPQGFLGTTLGAPVAGWVSVHLMPTLLGEADALETRTNRMFDVVGRLDPTGSPAVATERLRGVAEALQALDSRAWTDIRGGRRTVSVLSDRESRAPPGHRGELVVMGSASTALIVLLLLVVCTNVASLLMARAVARQREVAVRVSLGATRARLITQMLTESLLLSAVGASLGLVALVQAVDIVQKNSLFQVLDLSLDRRILVVTLALTVGCAILFGSAPIVHALRADVRSTLGSGATSPEKSRLRGLLIGGQVAAACLFILVAVSATRAVRTQLALDPGVSLEGLLASRIPTPVFQDSASVASFGSEFEELVRTTPGVLDVARTTLLPLGNVTTGFHIKLPSGTEQDVQRNPISASYFNTIGAHVIEGRGFVPADANAAPFVVVVNRALTQAFPEVTVGSHIEIDRAGTSAEVVGVVDDILYHRSRTAAEPLVYLHAPQHSWAFFQSILVAVPRGQEQLVSAELRHRVQERFPDVVAPGFTPMSNMIASRAEQERIVSRVALGVGTVELTLAMIGLYGLLLFVLASRTREVGVRLALGAKPTEASWAVLRKGLRYMLLGGAVGLLLGFPALRIGLVLLPGSFETGATPFLFAAAALMVAGVAASLVPAVRAARVQPAVALRNE